MKAYLQFVYSIIIKYSCYAFLFFPITTIIVSCNTDDPWKQEQLNLRLLEAVGEGNVEAVDSAINKGAYLESRALDGATPLILAASKGHSVIASRLLEKGAQVNNRRNGYYRSTALMETAVNNDTIIAKLLLDAGADIHIRDTFGDPAINWGAYYGHVPYVALLLESGANWKVESKHGTALDIANKEWNLDLHEFFIIQGAGEEKTKSEDTLIRSVKDGNISVVEDLLNQGSNPDLTDALGMPILVWAAANDNIEVLELLIEKGAKVNTLNSSGQTAVAAASRFGYIDIVELLINNDADVSLAGDRYHLTPIINAAIGGQATIARTLLESGANINDQDVITGFTPLMYAVAYGNKDFVELMIKRRANPYVKGHDGTGLYDLLSFSANEAIAKMLEAYILEKQ